MWYQAQLSGCSALPESPRQSLPHPYSPVRAPAFFRFRRNRVQASNPHLDKSFWMNPGLLSSPRPTAGESIGTRPDYLANCWKKRLRSHSDRKKPPPPGGFPINYVPSSRTVCERTPLEEPGTNPSRGVLLHTILDEGSQ